MSRRTRVLFLIRSLACGGAERQLACLASRLDPQYFDVRVLTFYPGGAVWDELHQSAQVHVDTLNKRGRWEVVRFVWRLVRYLRTWSPHILHSYLVEPSILGLVSARLAGSSKVIWGIRASNMDHAEYEWISHASFTVAARLSRFADGLVANSNAGKTYHVHRGYQANDFDVIENGIDTDTFQPLLESRCARRREWGVQDDEVLVGVAARLDPMKGHAVLFEALPSVIQRVPGIRIALVGNAASSYADSLRSRAASLGIMDRLIWAGELRDMATVYPAFDVLCSPSVFGEGFSNSIGEAMSCGVPCVVTDVGDSAAIVGVAGTVVPPNDEHALAEALVRLAGTSVADRVAIGAGGRDSVRARFSVDRMVGRSAAMYRRISPPTEQD